MKSVNPEIGWYQKSGKQCLRFSFGERLTEKEAEVGIVEWKAAFQSKQKAPVILIWDCRNMKGYETGARLKWTVALKEMKPQIETIWLISDSAIIRMGASVMGMISSVKIKAISSESEVEI